MLCHICWQSREGCCGAPSVLIAQSDSSPTNFVLLDVLISWVSFYWSILVLRQQRSPSYLPLFPDFLFKCWSKLEQAFIIPHESMMVHGQNPRLGVTGSHTATPAIPDPT